MYFNERFLEQEFNSIIENKIRLSIEQKIKTKSKRLAIYKFENNIFYLKNDVDNILNESIDSICNSIATYIKEDLKNKKKTIPSFIKSGTGEPLYYKEDIVNYANGLISNFEL